MFGFESLAAVDMLRAHALEVSWSGEAAAAAARGKASGARRSGGDDLFADLFA